MGGGVAFQRLTQGEQHHHQTSLGVSADHHRTTSGDGHEHVDVDLVVDGEGAPGAAGDGITRQQPRQDRSHVEDPVVKPEHRQQFVEDHARQDQRQGDERQGRVAALQQELHETGNAFFARFPTGILHPTDCLLISHVVAQLAHTRDYRVIGDLTLNTQGSH